MNAFVFLPIWCAIMYFVARSLKIYSSDVSVSNDIQKRPLWFALFSFLPIFLMATIAEPCMDTVAYLGSFNKATASFSNVELGEDGWLFNLFTIIIKKIFDSQLFYRIIIALVQSIPLIIVFRKYSHNYILTLFLFISSGSFFSGMMNGLRQFTAICVVFIAVLSMMEKKYLKTVLLILLATAIHQTAIIMLPVVFIANGKAFNKLTIICIVASVIAMSIFSLNTDLFEEIVNTTDYANGYQYVKETDDGVNPIRVLVSAVPVILICLDKKRLKEENSPFCNVCVNMSFINFGITLIAMVTSGIYTGRMIMYTQLFSFVLLPRLIDDVFSKKSKILVYFAMIVLYLIYYKYELGNFWNYNLDMLWAFR